MKKTSLILCFALLLSLFSGCQKAPAATTATTQAPAATAAATEATEPEPEPILTQEQAQAALDAGGRVVLGGDLALTAGLVVKDDILDGNGCTITGPVYDKEVESSSCAVLVARCTVENITVKDCYRAIGSNKENRCNGDIRINNVVADGENCALYIGQADNNGRVIVSNSSFGGQTVFNKVIEASFNNCTFTFNESGSKGNMTAYTDAIIVGCHFENKEDGTKYALLYPSSIEGRTMILEDCYVGDTLITQDNLKTLLKVSPRNNTIEVRNTIS